MPSIPPAGFRVSRASTDDENTRWELQRNDSPSDLLRSKLETDSKVFSADILVALTIPGRSYSSDDSKDLSVEQVAPKPDKGNASSRPGSPDVTRRHRGDSISSFGKDLSSPIETISSSHSPAVRSVSREQIRVPAPSSAFSNRRNWAMRGPVDTVIGEIIIDLRTYPEGYEVLLTSRLQPKANPGGPLPLSKLHETGGLTNELPITHSVYLLPPSPLYSSGSGADTPTRHLLRLLLPTAQFELPTLEDPLTGEMRTAPPKPHWYEELKAGEKHAIVHVDVRPLSADKCKKDKRIVLIDGVSVTISSEKDVYKRAASDEWATGTISRTQLREGENVFTLPDPLSSPLAVQDTLLDPGFAPSGLEASSTSIENTESNERGDQQQDREDIVPESSSGQITPSEDRNATPQSEEKRGFLGIANSYRNSLASLGFGATRTSDESIERVPASPRAPPRRTISAIDGIGIASSAVAVVRSARTPRYSLSTLLALVLIAFLLGSLLRSLLSPADFIYVVTDIGDVPKGVTRGPNGGLGAIEPGWREIKRLVELKYIVGGWDFQIAVVRRH